MAFTKLPALEADPNSQSAPIRRLPPQVTEYHHVSTLYDLARESIIHGFKLKDKELRNDIITVCTLIAQEPDSHAHFFRSGAPPPYATCQRSCAKWVRCASAFRIPNERDLSWLNMSPEKGSQSILVQQESH